MLADAVSSSLPMSVGVALSPLAVAAILIILMSARARTNAPAFLLGWLVGILSIGLVVSLMPGLLTSRGEPTQLSGIIRLALGSTLLLLAARKWWQRPGPETAVKVPQTLARLDAIGVMQSSVTGFLLSAIHPKNLILNVAGAAAIDAAAHDSGTQYIALVIFAFIASAGVTTPVAAYFIARRRTGALLARWKDWLIRNNVLVMFVLLLVLGAMLVARGLKILLA
jgi:hypothetical protein